MTGYSQLCTWLGVTSSLRGLVNWASDSVPSVASHGVGVGGLTLSAEYPLEKDP